MQSSERHGFTLIELSIVLVIIGLIVGGVLAGRALIKATQLRAAIGDVEEYKTAFHTFRLKYNCLPGDCTNATNIFSGSGTANGDGNGLWEPGNERPYVWEHMSLAGLVAGNYSSAGTGVGTYVPRSSIGGAGYWALFQCSLATPCPFFERMGNSLVLGRQNAPGSASYNASSLSSADAYDLDTKGDDGNPSSGKTMAGNGADTGLVHACTSVGAVAPDFTGATGSATYSMIPDQPACRVIFWLN